MRAGLHRTLIGRLERTERNPRLETMVAIADALEIPLAELVAGIGSHSARRSRVTG